MAGGPTSVLNATFQAGASLSDAVNVTGKLVFVCIPADWEPSLLSFQLSVDSGTTWFDLFNADNSEVMFNVTAGSIIRVETDSVLDNQTYIKIRSGLRGHPKPQITSKSILLAIV